MSNIPVFKPFLEDDEKQAAMEALNLGWLGPGSYVKEFEQKIANLLSVGAESVVAVSTGTAAVHLALQIVGVGHGDEVITPSFNNIADFQSICALGAEPVFCDVNEKTLTINPHTIEGLISARTKAIICIDYGAALCDYAAVKHYADKHNIPVIHDAAHAFGSASSLGPVGSYADISTFSFDPVKNITCIDGGAVVVKDIKRAEKIRYMRLLGQKQNQQKLSSNQRSWTYDVDDIGYRYHLANLHGAIGLVQLNKLEEIAQRRRAVFRRYVDALQEVPGLIIPPDIHENICPFIFVVRVLNGKRSDFREYLNKNGVDTGIHWQAGHKFTYFQHCRKGVLDVTEKITNEIVTIPFYPGLSGEEQEKVVQTIQSFFQD